MASSISDSDKVLVAQLCLPFVVDGSSLTCICKAITQSRYGPLKKDQSLCVACGKTILDKDLNSACLHHPGLRKEWVSVWEDSSEGMMFSGYTTYDCCSSFDACTKAKRHNVSARKCANCGKLVQGKATGPCVFHPARGATSTRANWDCCKAASIKSPGCKTEPNHHFEVAREKIHGFSWSRLGSKAVMCTDSGLFLLAYHAKSGVWTERAMMTGYPVLGTRNASDDMLPIENCFSANASAIIVYLGGEYIYFDIQSGKKETLFKTSVHKQYFVHSWGGDGRYLFFLANSSNSDYGEFCLNVFDVQTQTKMKAFVNFTTSIPFNYDRPPSLSTAYLIPAKSGEIRSFKHPALQDFISRYTATDAIRLMEPYGNRMLFVTSMKFAVHYSFGMGNGQLQVQVLGKADSIWGGIGNPLVAIQWIKGGFIALVQQNFKGLAYYKRHKYQVWWFNDKLEKTRTCKLPKEARQKAKEMMREDTATMFKYDEASKQFFFAQNSKFFVLNENLEILFTMPWGPLEYKARTYFHPGSRVAVYSANGLTARIPLNPTGDVEKGYLSEGQFNTHDVKIYKI